MDKLVIFGATGGVGQHAVRQALSEEYAVTAFVRSPEKLAIEDENLTVIQGDAMDAEAVAAAIEGADAVVSTLGTPQNTDVENPISVMIQNVVDGMVKHGVKRIVYTASAGVDGEIQGERGQQVMNYLKPYLIDHKKSIEAIQQAGLTYTIIRPMGLTNDEPLRRYALSYDDVPEAAKSISRDDVANAVIMAIPNANFMGQSIAVFNM
ncbi:NAD(P)-dependent oxidoreductase [Kurthia massiliensis]|uniref:NAD(P)-dependent oxidoreductase n=1 Tax=Kurthia massiliensis TaxID=1033739 RepID=UPI0002886C7F|nr:NAD(P)-binding oxidoreductase [Kurthia massiliensis]